MRVSLLPPPTRALWEAQTRVQIAPHRDAVEDRRQREGGIVPCMVGQFPFMPSAAADDFQAWVGRLRRAIEV